jgi:serine/threonine protein kinase
MRGTRVGTYTLVDELGRGAQGVVWKARDAAGAHVAIKRLDGAFAADSEWATQLDTLRARAHPGLVAVREALHHEGALHLVMEHVPGDDLVSHVRRDADVEATSAPHLPLAFGQALRPLGSSAFTTCTPAGLTRLRRAFTQLADALEALHALGFVHRDLHPANVRVTPAGRVVVLDLGTLPRIGDTHDPARAVGPVSHAAPELGDERPLAPASDWYAVGVLLFEALTGDLPFSGAGRDAFVRKQTVSAPSPGLLVRGVPADLDALTTALLATSPRLRADATQIRACCNAA